MAEDLGLDAERNRTTLGVDPIIVMSLKQVEISPTHSDGSDPEDNIPRRYSGVGHLSHPHGCDIL
jgi:hypothetical protein